jgi:hypothetical protein
MDLPGQAAESGRVRLKLRSPRVRGARPGSHLPAASLRRLTVLGRRARDAVCPAIARPQRLYCQVNATTPVRRTWTFPTLTDSAAVRLRRWSRSKNDLIQSGGDVSTTVPLIRALSQALAESPESAYPVRGGRLTGCSPQLHASDPGVSSRGGPPHLLDSVAATGEVAMLLMALELSRPIPTWQGYRPKRPDHFRRSGNGRQE